MKTAPLRNHERTFPDGRIYFESGGLVTFPDTFTAGEAARFSRDNFCRCRLECGDYWRKFYLGKEVSFWEFRP